MIMKKIFVVLFALFLFFAQMNINPINIIAEENQPENTTDVLTTSEITDEKEGIESVEETEKTDIQVEEPKESTQDTTNESVGEIQNTDKEEVDLNLAEETTSSEETKEEVVDENIQPSVDETVNDVGGLETTETTDESVEETVEETVMPLPLFAPALMMRAPAVETKEVKITALFIGPKAVNATEHNARVLVFGGEEDNI